MTAEDVLAALEENWNWVIIRAHTFWKIFSGDPILQDTTLLAQGETLTQTVEEALAKNGGGE